MADHKVTEQGNSKRHLAKMKLKLKSEIWSPICSRWWESLLQRQGWCTSRWTWGGSSFTWFDQTKTTTFCRILKFLDYDDEISQLDGAWRIGQCDNRHGEDVHQTVPCDQPEKRKMERSRTKSYKISNLLTRLASFLLMMNIAQMLAASVTAKMGRFAMIKAMGILFTMLVFSVTRLRDTFHTTSSIFSPSSILKWWRQWEYWWWSSHWPGTSH